jgi:nucleotide-binding universal stress UspA family protein
MSLRCILVATDFSEGAAPAIARGLAVARWVNAKVIVLHVCAVARPFPVTTPDNHPGVMELAKLAKAQREQGARRLSDLLEHLDQEDVETTGKLVTGSPAEAIADAARDLGADLVVTGSRGLSESGIFVMGSVAEGIAQRAEANVLIARGKASQPPKRGGFQKILVATDLTPASKATLPLAMQLAGPHADVEVLHVIERGDPFSGYEGTLGAAAVDFKMLWRAAVQEAQREIDSLVGRHDRANATVSHHVREGNAAQDILTRTQKGGHDLVVVGKRSDRPALVTSVAERVVRHAPCTVLVAKATPSPVSAV